jgi:hypothetical protein
LADEKPFVVFLLQDLLVDHLHRPQVQDLGRDKCKNDSNT